MYEHLLQLLNFLILIPFLLQRQKMHPKNMHFNNYTVIIFCNSNYTIFYHLGWIACLYNRWGFIFVTLVPWGTSDKKFRISTWFQFCLQWWMLLGLITSSTSQLRDVLRVLVPRNLSNFHEDQKGRKKCTKRSLPLAACQDWQLHSVMMK